MQLTDSNGIDMNDYAVAAKGLVKRFGEVTAVNGIDLSLSKGEIYGFLGPNGAGKTTVVRMLTTLLVPTSGSAVVAGHDVLREPQEVRLRIGAALQDAALDDKQTGKELLRLQGRLYGLNGREINRRLSELASLIDIGDTIDRMVGTYSGGMKRRLDLAAALVHNPEVLFLDEPTTGLDPISRNRVWDEVRRINRELGVTIFLTTQYLEEADVLADRVGIINLGELAAEGTPSELKRAIGLDVIVAQVEGDAEVAVETLDNIAGVDQVDAYETELTIRVANGASLISAIALALNECDVSVRELTLRTPTLDDVFLQVTGARLQEDARTEEAAAAASQIRARRPGFLRDMVSVAGRALRAIPRDVEAVVPALIIPVFFFVVNVGALQDQTERFLNVDYKAFQLPVAIIFAVTGVSRAITVVTDIQSGYFDKLSLTPVNRLAMLLGLTVADFALVVALTLPVILLGFIVGVRFESGPIGLLVFVLMAGAWGLVYTGFPYSIALKTGNPAAVNSSFLLFFPFVFLTTVFLPREALTGWMATVAVYNPVTYLLDGLRSLISVGWDTEALLKAIGSIAGVGVVSYTLALLALRSRASRR